MKRFRQSGLLLLLLTGACVYALPSATLFVAGVFYIHLVAGVFFLLTLLPILARVFRGCNTEGRIGWSLIVLGGLLGVALMFTGGTRPFTALLYSHIVASLLGVVF
ncbi:MAG: hypothetical protein ACRD5W_14425, partial [Candidatus Acidiferrales bacterium]